MTKLRFPCPHCGQPLGVSAEMAGKQGRCPACRAVVAIPALPSEAEPPVPRVEGPPATPRQAVPPSAPALPTEQGPSVVAAPRLRRRWLIVAGTGLAGLAALVFVLTRGPRAPVSAESPARSIEGHPEQPPPPPPPSPPVARPANREGMLARVREVGDFFKAEAARAPRQSAGVVLWSGEEWTVADPVCDLRFPGAPPLRAVPAVALGQHECTDYVPFVDVASGEMVQLASDKDACRAKLLLRNGRRVDGELRGAIRGRCDLGKIAIPWGAVKAVSVSQVAARPPVPLVIAARGVLLLDDGGRHPFESWAPVLGGIMTDMLLAESGSGPALLPLAESGALAVLGRDRSVFFWEYAVRVDPPPRSGGTHYIGLSHILLRGDDGIILVPAALVASISWGR